MTWLHLWILHGKLFFSDERDLRPNWSGFMTDVISDEGNGNNVADVHMLPIIDVNSVTWVAYTPLNHF
jgi:hypothetical protein